MPAIDARLRTGLRFLFLGAAAASMLSLAACSLLPKEEAQLKPPLVKPAKPNFTVYEVKRGDLVRQVSGLARYTPIRSNQLSFPESGGRVVSIAVKAGDRVQKGSTLVELDKGDLERKVRTAELNVEKTKIYIEQGKTQFPVDELSMRLRYIDAEVAKLDLDSLRMQLDKTQLKADMDGIVTYLDDTLKPGAVVTAFRPVVSLADPTQLSLVYETTSPASLSGIELNMDVEVSLDSGKTSGKVVQIPSSAPQTDNPAINDKNAKSIQIRLDALQPGVKIGDSAQIAITIEKRQNVLVVPRGSIHSYLGRQSVLLLDGQRRREVGVEVGLETPTLSEIKDGLKEGQQIILSN